MKINKNEKIAYLVAIIISLGFLGWWLVNSISGEVGSQSHELYGDSYWIVGLVGAIYGIHASKQWGGYKSIFGKSILFFSLGLLAQVLGQIIYSYFALVQDIEAPYPSIGDIGFFGSVLLYIYAIYLLAKATGARFGAAGLSQKIIAVIGPILLLGTSYYLFLKDYESTGDTLTTILDFGYPLGQATYVALALFVYVLSFKVLGGIMKNKILILLVALLVQYIADFTYLYRVSRELYFVGDFSDLLYQAAYFLMTIALISIGAVALKLRASK